MGVASSPLLQIAMRVLKTTAIFLSMEARPALIAHCNPAAASLIAAGSENLVGPLKPLKNISK